MWAYVDLPFNEYQFRFRFRIDNAFVVDRYFESQNPISSLPQMYRNSASMTAVDHKTNLMKSCTVQSHLCLSQRQYLVVQSAFGASKAVATMLSQSSKYTIEPQSSFGLHLCSP